MAEEARLQPLIQQAYGQPVQGLDTRGVQQLFRQDVERKRGEYKSALDIGSDLTKQYYDKIGQDLQGIIKDATQGNLKVGTPEWLSRVQQFQNKANQAKEIETQFQERREFFLQNPDQAAFYENINGELVDTGLDGFLRANENLLGQGSDNFNELISGHANLMQQMKVLPQGVVPGYRALRTDAIKVGEDLLASPQAKVSRSQVVPLGRGLVQVRTTTTLTPEATKMAVESLYDQHNGTIRDDYRRRRGRGEDLGLSEDDFVAQTIQEMLPQGDLRVDERRVATPSTTEEDTDVEFQSLGNGRYKFGNFNYRLIPSEVVDIGGRVIENVKGNTIEVWTDSESEPIKNIISADGTSYSGRLSSIVYSPNGGKLGFTVSGSNDVEGVIFPWDENEGKLREFYGLTKANVGRMLKGESLQQAPQEEPIQPQLPEGAIQVTEEEFFN